MLRRIIVAAATLVAITQAQPLKMEKPIENTRHSTWMDFGVTAGVLVPTTSDYESQSVGFMSVGLAGDVQFWPLTAMVMDLTYSIPHHGGALKLGLEQQLLPLGVTPFVGGATGFRYLGNPHDDRDIDFGESIGPLLEANAGVLFFRTGNMRVRLKGGYEWFFDKDRDQSWNASVSFLWATSMPGLRELDLSK